MEYLTFFFFFFCLCNIFAVFLVADILQNLFIFLFGAVVIVVSLLSLLPATDTFFVRAGKEGRGKRTV